MSREESWAAVAIVVIVPLVIFLPRKGLRESLLDLIPTIYPDQWNVIAIVAGLAAAVLVYLVGAVFVRQLIGRWIAKLRHQQKAQGRRGVDQ